MARLNSDGNLDVNFGTGGALTTQFTGNDQVLVVVVQPDGKIIANGQMRCASTGLEDLALARYFGE